MAEPLILDTLERLGRAIMATLAPATGRRSTGTITAARSADDDIPIPKNTYLMPVVGGKLRDDLLFKTSAAFTLTAEDVNVPITSNVGGIRHNLPAGTVFRFDPLIEGVEDTATLDADMTDGSDVGQLIKVVSFYEELDLANPSADLFASKVGDSGVMLVWTQSDPMEGTMSGLRQGATRATRNARFWRENFILYVCAARIASDKDRRQSGRLILQAVTRLLTDRHQNDDGEQLSTVGAGLEITNRARLGRSERHYIYALTLRANQTLEAALSNRAFERWLTTRYRGALPGREDPEPTVPLEVVDATDPMP